MSNKHLIGLKSEVFNYKVELEHLQNFAKAIGDDNPLYFDEEFAKNSIHGGIIAPPTYPIAIGATGGSIDLGLDQRRMLHGEQSFMYEKVIRPNDELTCQLVISDVYEKEGKNGKMEFILLDTEMRDSSGELVVISRTNIVYRPKKQAV
ncbi:MaoC family dehydratase N-terminal domain-containing protein [Kurthia zopfii]|uniref:MaoC family dehydratase N-terminal domain-containing protein n=1 Tax=Kurthia zopfii TaxID=1650 RepID=UPI000F71E718|nr:MaoC family dehydratase N-terminal domain-containing protein [Kurthia zopfii]VEI06901.1 (3R)-hydroxyacyl-ACP dehydratase subunit HadC [Kurthia zopfii]